jgi:hypothetical protein
MTVFEKRRRDPGADPQSGYGVRVALQTGEEGDYRPCEAATDPEMSPSTCGFASWPSGGTRRTRTSNLRIMCFDLAGQLVQSDPENGSPWLSGPCFPGRLPFERRQR